MAPGRSPSSDEKNLIQTASDDVAIEQRKRKRRLLEWLASTAVLRIFTMTFYLGYRVRCMLVGNHGFSASDVAVASVFFAMELLFAGKLMTGPTCTPQLIPTVVSR